MNLMMRTGIVVFLAVFVLTPPVLAYTGTGWLPDYSEQLGIAAADTPGAREEFSQFESEVTDPSQFKELSGREVEKGTKVTIFHAGNMRWSTPVDGVAVNPAAFRVRIEGEEEMHTFLPDRKDVKLKLYTMPPFRSSSMPRKN